MPDFFRFPLTPHLAWLSADSPREDKVMSKSEVTAFLAHEVVVEEKLDGANLGISLAENGQLQAQNRGQYLSQPFSGQFARLNEWLGMHEEALRSVLTSELILFGEWCAAKHSLDYVRLPDWFLLFDVYDRSAKGFYSCSKRNEFARQVGLVTVPHLGKGKYSLSGLEAMVRTGMSHYRDGPLEGVVVRRDEGDSCVERAKIVREDFAQAIEAHWRSRALAWNRVAH